MTLLCSVAFIYLEKGKDLYFLSSRLDLLHCGSVFWQLSYLFLSKCTIQSYSAAYFSATHIHTHTHSCIIHRLSHQSSHQQQLGHNCKIDPHLALTLLPPLVLWMWFLVSEDDKMLVCNYCMILLETLVLIIKMEALDRAEAKYRHASLAYIHNGVL